MINNWQKFNESSESLTKEMAQEIIFYFGESCRQSNDITKVFNIIYDKYDLGHIAMYETSYKEMMGYVDYLYNKAKGDSDLEKSLIKLYRIIRESLSGFPEVFEIEDNFLLLIDNGFELSIIIDASLDYSNFIYYSVKLTKFENLNSDQFFKFAKEIENAITRLSNYNPDLTDLCKHKSYVEFKFEIKKRN